MKTEQSNSQIWVDGHLVEVDLDTVAAEQLTVTPHLLDGFHPCAACEVLVLVEKKYCRFCQLLHDEFERRSPQQPRVDMGVVPYDPDWDPQPPSRRACFMFAGLILIFIGFAATGMWYAGRSLVGLWQHGW